MRRLLALILTGLTATAVACGSDANAAEVVRTAATKTVEADTARMATTIRLTGGPSVRTITGEGAFDFGTHRGRMTMDVGGMAGFGAGSIEAITDGGAFYVHLPSALASQFGAGKPWMKFDLAAAAQQFGIDASQLGGAAEGDPGQALEYLQGVSDDVEKLGDATVRGAATTHYRATVDLKKAASRLGGRQRDAVDKILENLDTTTFPADVWIDGAGRVRKMTWSQPLPARGGAAAARGVSVTMELYDFGTAVDATPPPADQVVDLADFLPGRK